MPPPSYAFPDALTVEISRVTALLPAYRAIGFGGESAALMAERDLQQADMAVATGDSFAMVKAYNRLRLYQC